MSLLIEPYLSRDGVIAMAAATFALGLIVGAMVMEFTHERSARKPRPARVRPPEPVKPAPRHRATPGGAVPRAEAVAVRPEGMPTRGTTSGAGQASGRIDVRV